MKELLAWKIHTPNLIKETLNNPGTEDLHIPYQILMDILQSLVERCSELNDPELNKCMARLTLYEVCDPQSPEFDGRIRDQLIAHGSVKEPNE